MDGILPAAGVAQPHAGLVPGGWKHASRAGRSHGGDFGQAGGGGGNRGPRFDETVPAGGYAWWYVDAISDDGRHALSIIAFIGSVFSPYYASARRRGRADPRNYCALNVALYGTRGKHWALTERGRASLFQSTRELAIGSSSVMWTGDALTIDIAELAIPRFRRLRGKVRLYPAALTDREFALDAGGRHVWRPIAPVARIDVQMEDPHLRWCGSGYLDSNAGSSPLEQDFASWTWSRAHTEDGAAIFYDAVRRDGEPFSLALRFDDAGGCETVTPPGMAPLPISGWRIHRRTRSEESGTASVLRTLEDTPFYARSLVSSQLLGKARLSMHESLSLDRFRSRWVQALLPFRMPRALR
jgi:carotenoid 1,2-hydratase